MSTEKNNAPLRCCPGTYCDQSNVVSPSWAWGKGVVQTSDGRTIICFSRQASVAPSASASTSGRRLMQQQAATSTPSTATVSAHLDLTQSRYQQGHRSHTCHTVAAGHCSHTCHTVAAGPL